MNSATFKTSILILGLWIAGAAGAHHAPMMERCQSLTYTGQIEQIEWRSPHVALLIQADSGESHRVIWLHPQILGRAGIERDTLRIGDEVTVTVGTRDDVVERPMLLASITRTSDGWQWWQVPQGC